jgi:dienelactone hydrolase
VRSFFALVFAVSVALSASAEEGVFGAEAYDLLKAMYGYDTDYPLHPRQVGRLNGDESPFEKIVFDSFHDGAVPGLLALPAAGEGPFPVVLLMHGLTGNKSQWLGDAFTHGGEVATGLLEAGYAVMALDAQYHGDRAVYNDYVDPGEMIFRRGWAYRYANMITQSVVDYRRAIDYLATRDDIDVERVGILGYSMGGHMTFILAAVEPRVRAVVACVVPAAPGMPMAAIQFAHDLGDRPLLMMMARQDQFYTVDQAQVLFDRVPGESKTLRFFDSGHSLPAEYTDEAVSWLGRSL